MEKKVLLKFKFNGEARWGECIDYEKGQYLCNVINFDDEKNWQIWVADDEVLEVKRIYGEGDGPFDKGVDGP